MRIAGRYAVRFLLFMFLVHYSATCRSGQGNEFIGLEPDLEQSSIEGATITYFGTTTLLFSDGKDSVITDAFFTRPGGLLRIGLSSVEPNPETINRMLEKADAPETFNAVLVSHTHYDHALDSAIVACQKKAVLVGTLSMQTIQEGQVGSRDDAKVCLENFKEVRELPREFGAWKVDAFESLHSDGLMMYGSIAAPFTTPAHFSRFRLDKNFSYSLRYGPSLQEKRLLVISGMPTVPIELDGHAADIVFLSIGGLRRGQGDEILEYWNRAVRDTNAKVVVPTHWDDFSKPLKNPLPVMPTLFGDFDRTMCQLLKLGKRDGVAVRLLPTFKKVNIETLKISQAVNERAARTYCDVMLRRADFEVQ